MLRGYLNVSVVWQADYNVVSGCPESEDNSETPAVMLMQSAKRSNKGPYMCSGNVHPVLQKKNTTHGVNQYLLHLSDMTWYMN